MAKVVGPFPQHYLDLRNGLREPTSKTVVSPGFESIVEQRAGRKSL